MDEGVDVYGREWIWHVGTRLIGMVRAIWMVNENGLKKRSDRNKRSRDKRWAEPMVYSIKWGIQGKRCDRNRGVVCVQIRVSLV